MHAKMIALFATLAILIGLLVPTSALAANCQTPELYATLDTGTTTPSFEHFQAISNAGPGGCTYLNLRITGQSRGTGTQCDESVWLQLGDSGTLDTGSHYDYQYAQNVLATPSSWGGGGAYQAAGIFIGTIPCSTRTAAAAGTWNTLIVNAFGLTYDKDVISQQVNGYNTNSGAGVQTTISTGVWHSTGSVSNVEVFPNTGSFDQHTVISLYLE